jgi:hypothetical protein
MVYREKAPRKCRVIRWPDWRPFPQAACIGQSQGCLHCIGELVEGSGLRSPGLSIWVLEDYDTEEWVLKHSLSLWQLVEGIDPIHFSLLYCWPSYRLQSDFFFVHCSDQKLRSYDVHPAQLHPTSVLASCVPAAPGAPMLDYGLVPSACLPSPLFPTHFLAGGS